MSGERDATGDSAKRSRQGVADEKSALVKAASYYRFALRTNPILTKSVTSGVIASLGNVAAQIIAPQGSGGKVAWRNVVVFGAFGMFITAPVTHHLYRALEQLVPSSAAYCPLKRLAVDRLIFAPPYLLVFFYVIALAEGCSFVEASRRVRLVYWAALKMNWRVWTLTQFVNFKYVPSEYQVLVANIVSFIWNVYLAAKR